LQFYILVFVLTSVCGWIMELLYSSATMGRLNIPGFLFGPYCTIYGFGTLIVLILCDDKNIIKRIGKIFILTTLLEYITSVILEKIVHIKWWDYSNNFLNINGRVSLLYSTYWVVIGLIILRILKPLFEKTYNRIQSPKVGMVLNGCILIIFIDMILSTVFA